LKQFRGKYDNEFSQSESIMDLTDITQKKKEIDKLLLNAIRINIISAANSTSNEESDKVFSYIDMLHFS